MNKVIIIDDEPLARSIVKEYLKHHPDIEIVGECNDGFEGAKAVLQHHPNLIFLDIQMPKINGFEMLEIIDNKPGVIFTTAFDEYAMKAFEVNAVDYLLKPFDQERFDKAIQKWIQQQNQNDNKIEKLINHTEKYPEEHQRIVVKESNNIKIIPIQDIYYIEAYDDYVKIYIKDKMFLKKKTMAYYEKILEESGFVRAHRSFIVNIQYITRIEPMEKDNHVAILTNGQRISLSKSGYSKLKSVLGI